jgi:benzoyl-CoA-dihydrodiol lyase
LADLFCTTAEGVRADRAKAWGLVDHIAPPQRFTEKVRERAEALAALSDRPDDAKGVKLPSIERRIDERGYHYEWVEVVLDPGSRTATLTVRAPAGAQPKDLDGILAAGAAWWPLAMARQLDDAILMLRINHLEVGTLVVKTAGDADAVLAADALMFAHCQNWFVRETINMLRRTLARLDVSSRSLFAIIDGGSCFAGTLLELALAADRSYMLDAEDGPRIAVGEANLGPFEMVNGLTRLATRFNRAEVPLAKIAAARDRAVDAKAALELGLVTVTPDELDWDDEIRLAVEERASLSPDALTGMEASLRFAGAETTWSKIFGRLSAWQNWIFIRPNAVGEKGALKLFGSGSKAQFNWERV